jgi:4-aminobutyrate aminotransferase/(S)-3-amino-2-methylpropionate transaminase
MARGVAIGAKREIPGRKSAELNARWAKYVPKAVFRTAPIFVARGRGAVVTDIDGNEYLDFAGGICVLNLGHCNPKIVAAVNEQAEKLMNQCVHTTMHEPYLKLAQKLTEITPGDLPKQAMLINSGAEAVENSIKISRKYTGRRGVIAFEGAFHGRTYLGMGLTSGVKYKHGFGPFDPSIVRFPYAYTYRAPFDIAATDYGKYCVARIEESFGGYMPADEIAALIVEPVLGEGGYVVPPVDFISGLRELCDRYGIVFIADEIQTGIARSGKMWAVEHFGVVPDILLTAKSLGGGMVLSAVIGKQEIMDSVDIGGLGGTFGGNPVSCMAALKVIEIIEEENLLAKATELGRITKSRLTDMSRKYQLIGDVRSLGSIVGVELVTDRTTKEPASEQTSKIMSKCLERGLILMSCGALKNVLRLMFPLVISEDELNRGLDILEDAIRELSG